VDNSSVDGEFLAVLNDHRGAIKRVARTYTSSDAEREELFQDIVYQLWRAFPSYQRQASVLTWVYRIAINTAITGLRRRSRRPVHVSLEAAREVPSSPTATELESRTELLYRLIQQLGDIDRALVMCYLDDLSYRQIADVLGLSETNVGARLSRAKARMQAMAKGME
jgi:RNA polymerase sigma-70 factor (ECF subfamily)